MEEENLALALAALVEALRVALQVLGHQGKVEEDQVVGLLAGC